MRRGDVYYVKAGVANNSGYTMWTPRPAVIISTDEINASEHTVEIVFLTSSPKRNSDFHVSFKCKDRNATALCEQVTTIDAAHLSEFVMHVPDDILNKISNAVCKSLGLCTDCTVSANSDGKNWKFEAERWKTLYIQQMKMTAEVLK